MVKGIELYCGCSSVKFSSSQVLVVVMENSLKALAAVSAGVSSKLVETCA